MGHIRNMGFSGGKSSLEIRDLTVQALKLFTNVLQDGSVLTYFLREGFVLFKLGMHIILSSLLHFRQFLIARYVSFLVSKIIGVVARVGVVVPIVGWKQSRITSKVAPISIIVEVVSRDKLAPEKPKNLKEHLEDQ